MNPDSIPLTLAKHLNEVCDRFEAAWKAGQRPAIEDYMAATPEPEQRALLSELLALEIELRRNSDEGPSPEEYEQRFPQHGELIRAAFAEARSLECASGGGEPSTSSRPSDDNFEVGESTPLPPLPAESTPTLPERIGRYKVCRKLGGGTFGDVYLAHDDLMDRQVAIKVPSAWLLASRGLSTAFYLDRFEARIVARLQHEGIVRAYDFGLEADGSCYIVYEFIEGTSLAERIKPERIAADPLLPEQAATIIAQVAEALHYAHLQGLVHRDIKPANILLNRQGKPCITDFGLAVREEDLPNERGRLAGTLPYMSPEQVRREGHHIDGRTDIYSLGVVLYELLCGRRPFEAKTEDELIDQILHREAKPPRQIKDSIPAELERICLKALSKRATERYTTARDLSEDLRHFQETLPPSVSPPDAEGRYRGGDLLNLLHLIWDYLDPHLQDAFSLAYNKKQREGSNRISTRDLFQALLRIKDDALRILIESLPKGALPDPVGSDVGVDRHLLNANPLLSNCVEDSLRHLILRRIPKKVSPVDIFVDIGQYGHGPSVARLRKHGITPDELEKRVQKHGLSVLRRVTNVLGRWATPPLAQNVQFTVYRPKTIWPQEWYAMLAFAHLSERPPGASENEPDPVQEVKRQALQILGEKQGEYRETTQDSARPVPQEGELTFVPDVPGIEFNPPLRNFVWKETVHREEFRLRASAELDGQTAKGRMSVFLGSIILAEVALSIRVDSSHKTNAETESHEIERARPYRKIFASYSRKDSWVVGQFKTYAQALGDEYVRKHIRLRAGEEWSDRLQQLIRESDIFQLFWSSNSMHSPFIRREWECALALGRANFIRPCYWEEPLPTCAEKNLPPEELRRIHFQRIPVALSQQIAEEDVVLRTEKFHWGTRGKDTRAGTPAYMSPQQWRGVPIIPRVGAALRWKTLLLVVLVLSAILAGLLWWFFF